MGLRTRLRRILESTQAYRLAQDVLARFLDDATDRSSPEGRVSPRKLYRAYQYWCDQTGERPVPERSSRRRSRRRASVRGRTKENRFWRGIRLLPEFGLVAAGRSEGDGVTQR